MYDEICPLPRWAYSDSEFRDCVCAADKIVDGHFYVKIQEEELDALDCFMSELLTERS